MRSRESASVPSAPGICKGPSSPGRGNAKRMRDDDKQSPDETALKRAVRHPKRLEMLGYLAGRKIGTGDAELASALGLSLPRTRYHLKVLQAAELIANVDDPTPGMASRYVVATVSQ